MTWKQIALIALLIWLMDIVTDLILYIVSLNTIGASISNLGIG